MFFLYSLQFAVHFVFEIDTLSLWDLVQGRQVLQSCHVVPEFLFLVNWLLAVCLLLILFLDVERICTSDLFCTLDLSKPICDLQFLKISWWDSRAGITKKSSWFSSYDRVTCWMALRRIVVEIEMFSKS